MQLIKCNRTLLLDLGSRNVLLMRNGLAHGEAVIDVFPAGSETNGGIGDEIIIQRDDAVAFRQAEDERFHIRNGGFKINVFSTANDVADAEDQVFAQFAHVLDSVLWG